MRRNGHVPMVPLSTDNELVFMAAMLELRRRLAEVESAAGWSRVSVTIEVQKGKALSDIHVAKNDSIRLSASCKDYRGG